MIRKRMKNFLSILLVCAMSIMLLGGCGGKEEENSLVSEIDTEDIGQIDVETTESDEVDFLSDKDEETNEEEITYIEHNDIYLLSNASNDGTGVDFSSFELERKEYTLQESIQIYYTDESLAGYTKENVPVYVVSSNDEWSFCSFGTDGYLIKKNELMDAILIEEEKVDKVVESVPQTNVSSEPVADKPVAETSNSSATVKEPSVNDMAEMPIETHQSDKYTPDEAISVYRSLMETGGMTWDPGLKGVTSWGTGWIYLDKGQPEFAASTDLESCAMGDSGGRSWTKYYLEVTGSDESKVYITEWTSN